MWVLLSLQRTNNLGVYHLNTRFQYYYLVQILTTRGLSALITSEYLINDSHVKQVNISHPKEASQQSLLEIGLLAAATPPSPQMAMDNPS